MTIACLGSAAGVPTRNNAGYWNGKAEMDCAARGEIQFSDSNGVRRLPAAKGLKKTDDTCSRR
jgi:hypothetical protein